MKQHVQPQLVFIFPLIINLSFFKKSKSFQCFYWKRKKGIIYLLIWFYWSSLGATSNLFVWWRVEDLSFFTVVSLYLYLNLFLSVFQMLWPQFPKFLLNCFFLHILLFQSPFLGFKFSFFHSCFKGSAFCKAFRKLHFYFANQSLGFILLSCTLKFVISSGFQIICYHFSQKSGNPWLHIHTNKPSKVNGDIKHYV